MTRQKECKACILGKNCIFPKIFNPLAPDGQPVVPPFCLEPDLNPKCEYNAGESFEFGLKLFAYAVEYLPFFIQAFRLAGEYGMGAKDIPGCFSIKRILYKGKTIFEPESDELEMPPGDDLPYPALGPGSEHGRITLSLPTPLRFKQNNHFAGRLEFAAFCSLVLRRAATLSLLEGSAWRMPAEEYRELLEQAGKVEIVEDDLAWHDWTRYSSRQDMAMKFGGLTGSITYGGNIDPLMKIIEYAQIAHIGKQTSFGLGKIEVK